MSLRIESFFGVDGEDEVDGEDGEDEVDGMVSGGVVFCS